MAVRDKVTAYIPLDMAKALKRIAAVKGRSVSDIVEDAIAKSFSSAGGEVEHAAIMSKLDLVHRAISVLEKGQETHFELTAHTARFTMSVTSEISDNEKAVFNARGAERFRTVIDAIIGRLSRGRSVLRDNFPCDTAPENAATPVPAPAPVDRMGAAQ